MAKLTKALTNTEVDRAKIKDKLYYLIDGQGLRLRINPNNKKNWVFRYRRPSTKKETTITIGNYPSITIAQAREKRAEYLALLAQGIDPQIHQQEQAIIEQEKNNNTFQFIAEKFLAIKATRVKPNTLAGIKNSLINHVYPKLGHYPIASLRAKTVIDVLEKLNHTDDTKKLDMIKRVCQRMNEVMTYAVNTGYLESNCLSGIGQAFETPKVEHQKTIRPEELPELIQALNDATLRDKIKIKTRCMLEFQLHTMTRSSETALAQWSEIDLDNQLWIIPAERMKMGKEHRIPLTEPVLTILEIMRPISGRYQYIFNGDRDPHSHASTESVNKALKVRLGFDGRLVAHGMRALASTTLNEQGFDYDVIESALAHTGKDQVRNAYNRATYLDRRRIMMSWWSNHIIEASQGNLSLSGTKALKLVANK